jgi:hypothetical protein
MQILTCLNVATYSPARREALAFFSVSVSCSARAHGRSPFLFCAANLQITSHASNQPVLHVPNKQKETITTILVLVVVVREPIEWHN